MINLGIVLHPKLSLSTLLGKFDVKLSLTDSVELEGMPSNCPILVPESLPTISA